MRTVRQDALVDWGTRVCRTSSPLRVRVGVVAAMTFCGLLASCASTPQLTSNVKQALPPGCTQARFTGPYGCGYYFLAAADRRIHREVKFLFSVMPGQRGAIASSEKAWLKWRDADCHVVDYSGDYGLSTARACETALDSQYSVTLRSLYVELAQGDAQLSHWP